MGFNHWRPIGTPRVEFWSIGVLIIRDLHRMSALGHSVKSTRRMQGQTAE